MAVQEDLDRDSGKLETAFFAGGDAKLLEEFRTRTDEERRLELLREIVAIQDRAFLDRLVALGVTPPVALAVALVPLVVTAWADGEVDDRERAAILRAAEERGVVAGGVARRQLEASLSRKPDPRLFQLWKAYVTRLWGCFTTEERWRMRENVLRSTREVAEAAGGFLGLTSKISAAERGVIEEIERILD